jgi:hypothetical protein
VAIAVDELFLIGPAALGALEQLELFAFGGGMLGRGDIPIGQVEDVAVFAPDDARECGVEIDELSVHPAQGQPDGQRVEEHAVVTLALAEGMLGAAAFGDLGHQLAVGRGQLIGITQQVEAFLERVAGGDVDADHPDLKGVTVARRRGHRFAIPAHITVVGQQAIFQRPVASAGPQVADGRAIFGMHQGVPVRELT